MVAQGVGGGVKGLEHQSALLGVEPGGEDE